MTTANHRKNGEVAVTLAVIAICRVVKSYGPKLNQWIADQVTAGKITSAQGDQLTAMLSTVVAACDIWRLVTGY